MPRKELYDIMTVTKDSKSKRVGPYLEIDGELEPIVIHSSDEGEALSREGKKLMIAVVLSVGEKVVSFKNPNKTLEKGQGFEEIVVWARKKTAPRPLR